MRAQRKFQLISCGISSLVKSLEEILSYKNDSIVIDVLCSWKGQIDFSIYYVFKFWCPYISVAENRKPNAYANLAQ